MTLIDQSNDPAFGTLYRQIERMPALEGFVKHASVDHAELAALPDTAFAWPDARKFPIHTPEHAALSYAYCKAASEQLPPEVYDAVKSALDVYDIPDHVFDEQKIAAAPVDDSSDYVLPDLHVGRVKSAAEYRRVQTQILEDIAKLDAEHRATAGVNLVKKAEEFNVRPHIEAQKLAGRVVSNTAVVRDWLEARASVAPAQYKTAYERLAAGMATQAPEVRDRRSLMKLASTIAELDERAGLERHYDRRLPDPIRTVFNTEKVAEETVDLCGTMVPVSKLAGLPASFWEDLGGPELSRELQDAGKIATVVETLPLDLKIALKSQLRM